MDITVLRHFLVIVEKHSISSAAHYLHMSQPTLSRQIGELERDLGVTLFTRGPREITMTQDGHYLVARAKDIIALVDKTTNNLHAGEGTIRGELNIGAVESTKLTSYMKVIDAIIQDFPDVRIQLHTGSNSEVQAQLDSGVLDFGIVVGKMPLHQYSTLKFPETECWGLSLPKNHALAKESSITIT
ncbi:putative transcriptional regulator [Secundilactobacillus oryzae JCM 18671]|uniref:Putative transcriptional regulator n=1 Tax=Secundilactobacillus oryzae JCM 18671 TaxID=1291743 RepID=A0A081BHK4_9LACO|nr:LysR family transcriptional regulator [Secundilactobacillus oryzae]GAK47522.1 putative transcriptional regulator [Secundilactobacillus oryzae JCM 18671]